MKRRTLKKQEARKWARVPRVTKHYRDSHRNWSFGADTFRRFAETYWVIEAMHHVRLRRATLTKGSGR